MKLYNFFPHLGATSDTENDPENITNTDDEIEEQVKKLKLNRKSVGLRELNNKTEESSVNDESGEANEETIAKPSVVLKRRTKSIMPSTESKAVPSAQSEFEIFNKNQFLKIFA